MAGTPPVAPGTLGKVYPSVTSQKNKAMLHVIGYIYSLEKTIKDRKYWCCKLKQSSKCKGRAITITQVEGELLLKSVCHTHPPDATEVERNVACHDLKETAQVTRTTLALVVDDIIVSTSVESTYVKSELLEQIQGQLSDILDKTIQEAAHSYSQRLKVINDKDVQKQVNELMEIPHIQTIYHMFVAVLLVFIISTAAMDFIDEGRLITDFELFFFAFGKFPVVISTWIFMFLYTLVVPYLALYLWGGSFHSSRFPRLHSIALGVLVIFCQAYMLGYYPVHVVIQNSLPPASRFIVILEQVRFLMKSYAFLRENVPKIIHIKQKPGEEIKIPQFSSYLYFLFCPVLIYRDSYPRTAYIRWKYVAKYFAQVIGGMFYGYFVLLRLCIPLFTAMNKQPFSKKTLVLSLFQATLPGTFMLLIAFYLFLHCWLNAFAEMLRFADRMFYQDWWNSTSFSNYYRTWNVVVHDFLFYYVYQDFLWLFGKKMRTAGMLTVFFVSAIAHEYVLTLCLGYFYPVMFCLFAIIGVVFNFTMTDKRKGPVWNIIVWTFLFIGQGIQLSLYSQEWYAQIHCPLTEKSFWELITPRSWSCQQEG
ncbi:sterol O-acyltransferase 2 [Protopterus annectens]|uniref:sterol O-acyltransferase 2 n=1 Tax=Protopterus annectens TaxID=7888 RepID=UPI001CFC224E|nr:sterol O-acyltransferase 2 [Protopterus annectens]